MKREASMQNLPRNGNSYFETANPSPWSLATPVVEEDCRLLDLRLAPLDHNEVMSLDATSGNQQNSNWLRTEGSSEEIKPSVLTTYKDSQMAGEAPYSHCLSSPDEGLAAHEPSNQVLKFAHSPVQEGTTPTSTSNRSKAVRCLSSSDDIGESEYADGAFKRKLRLDKDQFALLEEIFSKHQRLTPKHKVALAKQLNVRTRQIEVWFQNRRARTKVKQTEIEREKLKAHCEALTEENLRLQALVHELKANQGTSASMLRGDFWNHNNFSVSVCPSCQRVSSASATPYEEPSNAIVLRKPPHETRPLNLL